MIMRGFSYCFLNCSTSLSGIVSGTSACKTGHSRGRQLNPRLWAASSHPSSEPGGLCRTQQARAETLSASIWGPVSAPASHPGWGPCILALLVEMVLRRTFGYLSPRFLGVRWQSAPSCHECTFRLPGLQTLFGWVGSQMGFMVVRLLALGPSSVCGPPTPVWLDAGAGW